jgi:hypothetical protein
MPETSSEDHFFKVRHAAQPQECLVASSSKLIWLDLRVRERNTAISFALRRTISCRHRTWQARFTLIPHRNPFYVLLITVRKSTLCALWPATIFIG